MYLGLGPKGIAVMDVDEAKAKDLEARYKKYFKDDRLRICRTRDLAKRVSESDLLINATPVGMKEADPLPVDVSLLHDGLYVYDLVYNRPMTSLVKEAHIRKLHTATGFGMLLYQGAIAFEIWTGEKAPLEVMKRALIQGLQERG
jgi:shikimate dehydrogenase